MDDVVENFRENKLMKLKALSTIISILDLNPSSSEGAKDSAVEYYAKTLDEIQALSSSATWRGELAQHALQQRAGSHDRVQVHRGVSQDAEIDELISRIS